MKKVYIKLLSIAAVFLLIVCFLNIKVTTKQGIDYNVREIRMPLYLKILDFIDRHYNYKNLVANILGGTKDGNAKVIKIFNWVTANVRKAPAGLPVIDDHPRNILIRGYGTRDQIEDIFTLLCNYAEIEAFFKLFENNPGGSYYMSFVKIGGKWRPLSAFAGAYSVKGGVIASVDDIIQDKKLLAPFSYNLSGFDADTFLKEIKNINFNTWSVRTKGQSPVGRVSCFIKNILRVK